MLRLIVVTTPVLGAILFPLIVPYTIVRLGPAPGVVVALVFSALWFVGMLRTSEMPH